MKNCQGVTILHLESLCIYIYIYTIYTIIIYIIYIGFGLVEFYSISTIVGYLMPNPFHTYIYIKYIWFSLIGFYGISNIVSYLKPNPFNTYIYIKYIWFTLATKKEGDPKAPFSIATTPRCRGGRYSFPWIAPLYPWSVPYNAEC